MNIFKEVYKTWNRNFNRGLTIFQIFLMVSLIFFAFQSNEQGILFSMTACLLGYLESNQPRFSIKKGDRTMKNKNIIKAINELQTFLECDMWTKFKPETYRKKKGNKIEVWIRTDKFRNKKEFYSYLKAHFDILKKQVEEL